MRSIPNQPSNELGAPLTVCHVDSRVEEGIERISKIELVLVNGFGEVVGEWSSSFDPAESHAATPFAALGDFVLGLLQNRVLVSHHVESALRLLDREFTLAAIEMPELKFLDTMDLSRQILPALTSYGLDALASRMGINATSPANRIWQLLCHLQALDPQDLTAGLELVAAPTPSPVSLSTLENLTVCVSGFLPHRSQEQLLAQVSSHGGTALAAPNPSTDLVVLGLGYNPALAAFAISLGLPLLGIEWFDLLCQDPHAAMLRAGSMIPRSMAATEPGTSNPPHERQQ